MKRSQADRSVIAARAAQNSDNRPAGASRSTGPVSRNLLARTPASHPTTCVGSLGKRTPKPRYSGSGDKGYRSAWSGKTDMFTDPKWDQTTSSQHVGEGGFR